MMTSTPDLFHRVCNDFNLGVGAAGLVRVKQAFRPLGKLYRGAFQTDANYGELMTAAKHLKMSQTSGFVLFQLLCQDLAVEAGLIKEGETVGIDKEPEVWTAVVDRLLREPLGPEMKTSRWWSAEKAGQHFGSFRTHLLFLLTYVGCLRQWWKCGSCPLVSQPEQKSDSGVPLGEDGHL
eukprot:3344969-Amphidinium_carterae.1